MKLQNCSIECFACDEPSDPPVASSYVCVDRISDIISNSETWRNVWVGNMVRHQFPFHIYCVHHLLNSDCCAFIFSRDNETRAGNFA